MDKLAAVVKRAEEKWGADNKLVKVLRSEHEAGIRWREDLAALQAEAKLVRFRMTAPRHEAGRTN